MNCRDAQLELALLAGEDLGDAQRRAEIEQHLAQCPACRRRHAGVKTALVALASSDGAATYDSFDSVWPEVRRRIARGERSSAAGRGWQAATPMVAGLVVCAGLLISTGLLLRNPVGADRLPVSTEFAPGYDSRSAVYPGRSFVAPAPQPQVEESAGQTPPRNILTRKYVVPQE